MMKQERSLQMNNCVLFGSKISKGDGGLTITAFWVNI